MKKRSIALETRILPRAAAHNIAVTNSACNKGTNPQKIIPSNMSDNVRRPETVSETNEPKTNATNSGRRINSHAPSSATFVASWRYVAMGWTIMHSSLVQQLSPSGCRQSLLVLTELVELIPVSTPQVERNPFKYPCNLWLNSSLVSKGHHGVDLRRPPCRQPTRQ